MLSEKPLISVIVPVYNIMEYLPRCVKSIASQTYTNLEIILVDDGSTDKTGELCDSFASKDERIRVFHKENGGSSSARNYGLSKARGEYVGFIDSDDYIEPDMYSLLYSAIRDYGAEIAQIGRDEIDIDGRVLPNICEPPKESVFISSHDFFKELLMHRGDCSYCTKLLKKELFNGKGFPVGELNEDFKLLISMLPNVKGIVSVPGQKYHVFYRIGSNSRKENKNIFSRVYKDSVNNSDVAADITDKEYPDLKEVSFRFSVFQRIEYMLHIPVGEMKKDNEEYVEIVKWLRKNWLKGMRNPILTFKNKTYHTIFAIAPHAARAIHKKIKHL